MANEECLNCGENIADCKCVGRTRLNILESQAKAGNKLMVRIADDLAMTIAKDVLLILNEYSNVVYIELKARGRHISKAIDVLEILKRELDLRQPIVRTATNELINRENMPVKVSEIQITLAKKDNP